MQAWLPQPITARKDQTYSSMRAQFHSGIAALINNWTLVIRESSKSLKHFRVVHYSNFSLYIASVAAAEIVIFLSNWGELTIRGVNRHEHDPRNGHVVDRESMIKVAWLDSRSFGAEDFADVNVCLRTSDSIMQPSEHLYLTMVFQC